MQAIEQTAILDAEKEWKILNQLAEIAADIENQTSYYSFQLEESNQISGTLLVDVHSWISQLQSLVPNTIPKEVLAVALPNPSPTASASDSQNESAEASSDIGEEIDEKVINETADDESGADSSTYLGAVAEAVAQELQGNPTAGFENADVLGSEETNENIQQSVNSIEDDDEELATINQAIEEAEKIEAQSLSKAQLNPELEDKRESNMDEVQEENEEEEAASWFQEELAEEQEALVHKDSGREEIDSESVLQEELAEEQEALVHKDSGREEIDSESVLQGETQEPLQVGKTEEEILLGKNANVSDLEMDTTDHNENPGKLETFENVISNSHDTNVESADAQTIDSEEFIKDDKHVLSRIPEDVTPANEPIIADDSNCPDTSESLRALATEDINEPLEILTPSEVELLASEASHGGVVEKEKGSEDEEDLVVELELESEDDPQNPAIHEHTETTTQIAAESDKPDQTTIDHKNLNQDFAPGSASIEVETSKFKGEISNYQEFDTRLHLGEVENKSSEFDELQEISVEEDEVEENESVLHPEHLQDALNEETVSEEARELEDTRSSQTANLDRSVGSASNEKSFPEHYFSDEIDEKLPQELDSEQEIFPEAKDLKELEAVESSDSILIMPEPVSDSNAEEIANPTDHQSKQSTPDLRFLQERYNRIADAALQEGKLELAKDCYDSLAKILKLMK